jgi:L-amino acid N-acyltransferase YncA
MRFDPPLSIQACTPAGESLGAENARSDHFRVDSMTRSLGIGRSDAMNIREATRADFDHIWPIFHEIVAAGNTYACPRDTTREQAMAIWLEAPRKTYVLEDAGNILGTYYLKTNQPGPGDHVCNCGYMVASAARGRGLASAMCEHSQAIARGLGYKAMQYNFVATSNEGAIRLWHTLGFATVGRLPKAFHHPAYGYVDALVMYKWLAPNAALA